MTEIGRVFEDPSEPASESLLTQTVTDGWRTEALTTLTVHLACIPDTLTSLPLKALNLP